jgi:hypothetical protein
MMEGLTPQAQVRVVVAHPATHSTAAPLTSFYARFIPVAAWKIKMVVRGLNSGKWHGYLVQCYKSVNVINLKKSVFPSPSFFVASRNSAIVLFSGTNFRELIFGN